MQEKETGARRAYVRYAIEKNLPYLQKRFHESKEDKSFDFPPTTVDVHLGYKGKPCQNKCVWCYDDGEGVSRSFGEKEIVQLQREIDKINEWEKEGIRVENINIAGGGEPTLFPKVAALIINRFTEAGKQVRLITNGISLPDDLLASVLKINGYNVSLNGCDRESYLENTKYDGFDKAMQNLERLITARKESSLHLPTRIDVSYVFNSNNIYGLKELIFRLAEMGVDSFRCRFDLFSDPQASWNEEGQRIIERVVSNSPDLGMKIYLKSPESEVLPSDYECYGPFLWPTWNPLHGVFPCAHVTDEKNRIPSFVTNGVYSLREVTASPSEIGQTECHRRCPSVLHWLNLYLNNPKDFEWINDPT